MSDIGRNENSSLTKQHNEMKHMLIKEIEVSERRYKDEEDRIRSFTTEQHNINKSLEDFKLFMESWQRLAANSHNQNIRIIELEKENQILKNQLSDFVRQTEKREHGQSL